MEKYLLGLLVLSSFKTSLCNNVNGVLNPKGRLNVMQGDTIEVNCTKQNANYTIDSLNFSFKLTKNQPPIIIENAESITIDDKTKMYRIVNAPKMDANLDCMLDNTGIDRVGISVGSRPEKVINFKCLSYDWRVLKCDFERPFNPIAVNYTLKWRCLNDNTTSIYPSDCLLKPNYNRVYTCEIDYVHSYRPTYEYYFFQLSGVNEFGTLTEYFTIQHFNHMIPSSPTNLSQTNITSDSVVINWNLNSTIVNFPRQFVYMINYTSIYHDKKWVVLGPFTEPSFTKRKKDSVSSMSYTLTNLPYANVNYDYRIRLRVKDAEDIPEMWSPISVGFFQTAPRIPDDPPATDIGSFYFTDSGHVFIYWKELHIWEHNGDYLDYEIVDKRNKSYKSSRTLVKLEQINSNNIMESLDFQIYSRNEVGRSIHHSTMRIPSIRERCALPEFIKKFRLDNKTYDISWVAPNDGPNITSYTLFWCESNNESPTDCKESIDFVRLDGNVNSYRMETNRTMNFAISANSDRSSSGMKWALCTVLPGNEINKLTSIITIKVQSTSIEFKWNLDCIDRTVLTGYELEYCPIKDPKTEECKEPPKSHNISAEAKEYKLEELRPYTTYSVRIRMFSKSSIGPWSEPQVNTTLEAAPTPPLNLRYDNITNSSVALTWSQPDAVNGVIVRYEVSCNGKIFSVERSEGTQHPYILSGLQSFTEYEVVVKACTVLCSDSSNPVIFNTSVGYPGVIQQPKVINRQLLKWDPPAVSGGRLEYYEVLVAYTNNGKQERTVQINGTTCRFTKEFHDILGDGQFDYSVRGVNVLQSSHFKGTPKRKRDLAQKYIDIERDYTKGESNLLKRHSKPEIGTESSANNLNHKFDAIHKPSEHVQSDGTYKHYSGTPSIDLSRIQVCEEESDQRLQNYLKADKWPTLFKGPYSVSYTFQSHSRFSSNGYLYMMLFLFIFTMAFVYGTFFALKKLKRMKDISVELPEGLEDIKEEGKAKHLESGITRDELGHTLDYRTNNEQENDPLVRFRMESASSSSSSSSSSESNSQSEYNEGMDNSIEYEQNTEEDSMQSGSDNLNAQHKKTPPTPLIPVQQSGIREGGIIQNPTPPSPLLQMSPNAQHLHNHFNTLQITQPSTMQPLTSNGYVTHEAIMGKPAVTSGYTPWSTIDAKQHTEQSNPTHTDEIKAKTPIITSTDIQGISGYVTHKQLSDFGQLMH